MIKNTSAIPTRAWLRFERFRLVHEENKITLKPKTTSRLNERYRLSDGANGIGFGCDRGEDDSPIELAGFGRASVAVYALAELWGEYEDTLVSEIEGVDERHMLPVRCRVDGAPVRLFTGRMADEETNNSTGEIPVVRFGSLVQADASRSKQNHHHVRKLQIQNTSRVPIEIEWRAFVSEPGDRQLIDLNLVYPELGNEAANSYSSSLDGKSFLYFLKTLK